jgi:sulfur carrier protein ThiS
MMHSYIVAVVCLLRRRPRACGENACPTISCTLREEEQQPAGFVVANDKNIVVASTTSSSSLVTIVPNIVGSGLV